MKKFLKIIFIIIIIIFVILFIFFNIDKWKASKRINDIENYAEKVEDIGFDQDKDIIALGEATHGNKEFQELKLEIFKQLVEKYNYKSLLFEMDYGEGLFINDFINNKSDLTIDEIMNTISFDIYKTKEIKKIILWMKEYNVNKNENEKLSFYGFDIQNPEKSIKYLINYMDGVDKDSLEVLNGIVQLDDENVKKSIEYLKTLHSDDTLTSHAIDNILNSYDYYLNTNLNNYVEMNNNRDKLLSDNILWIYEFEKKTGNDKLMISAHNGHIAKYEERYKNFGSILKERLNDKYYALGTDYFKNTCNIKLGASRVLLKTNSASVLAYQAKYFDNNRYYLDFKKASSSKEMNLLINSKINHGSLGETYSPLMRFIPKSGRIVITPIDYYDGMIFMYEVTPLDFM